MNYFFILGKNPTLSAAEIYSLFSRDKIGFKVIGLSTDVLIIESEKELDVDYLMKQLGGVIKIGRIHSNKYSNIFELHSNELINFFLRDADRKTLFGFSLYKLNPTVDLFEINKEIKRLALEIKEKLKEEGRPSRYVVMRQEAALSSVAVKKNNLIERGAEIVVLVDKNKIYLGKTLAIQEFEDYSFRDYGRPGRDILSGMMPPKLAKMMINLAQVNFDGTILDPFCGSGTILGEAMLMGYKNLIGSDISEKAIEDTKKNIEWLGKNFRLKIEDLRLINRDVRRILEVLKANLIDAIITEPYLGPPLKPSAGLEEMKQIALEISKLYLEAFKVFKTLLKPKARIVIIFPAFKPKEEQKIFHLPILKQIKDLGFKIVSPLPQGLESHSVIKITDRGSIIYSRPDQRVLREIFIWGKL